MQKNKNRSQIYLSCWHLSIQNWNDKIWLFWRTSEFQRHIQHSQVMHCPWSSSIPRMLCFSIHFHRLWLISLTISHFLQWSRKLHPSPNKKEVTHVRPQAAPDWPRTLHPGDLRRASTTCLPSRREQRRYQMRPRHCSASISIHDFRQSLLEYISIIIF